MKALRIGLVLSSLSIATFAVDTEAPSKETDLSKDAPNILYVVPWSETQTKTVKDPKLVLHNMVGDLYEPQIPSDW
ncbi:MAG TPA: hypothetical protein VL995_03485 [Cellvibrio sp.]|nr:hypothetical protein [Cellvibrio sp.]